jgi:predicted MFS family arabinose efflux permease
MAARLVAGVFGGPATSLAYSIVADVIPAERRGKALGAVMGAFSIASVLGVPAGLELARRGGWQLPFVAVAFLGAALAAFASRVLPPMTAHLARHVHSDHGAHALSALREIYGLFRADVLLSLTMTFFVMASSFVIVPTFSAYLLGNLGYPRDQLGVLYLVGGSVSFVVMRFVGRLVDAFGSARVGTLGALGLALVVYLGFVRFPPPIPVIAIFVSYMVVSSLRNVSYNTLTSKVPAPDERARFGSVQSAVQHLASAAGAFASAQLLVELDSPPGALGGIPTLGWLSIALGFVVPPAMWIVEARVARRASPA